MMDTFTVRDLRERTGALIHDAEKGKLSLITKRGKPVILAVPFNQQLIEEGLGVALAVGLFQEGILSLERCANLAHQPLEIFMATLGKLGIPVIDYPPEDLDKEIKFFE